jgi:lysophospholipase L1-like esterase
VIVIANVLGMTPLNKGVPSNTSTMMLARFAADIVANAPAKVLIESAAVNDIPTGISAATNKNNLEAMIQAAIAAGIEPILLTQNLVASSTWINAMPPYLANVRSLAGKYGLRILDWYRLDMETWFYLPNPNSAFAVYEDDYQHPNDAGVALLGPEASRVLLGI